MDRQTGGQMDRWTYIDVIMDGWADRHGWTKKYLGLR